MNAVNLLPPDLRGTLKSPRVAAAGEPAGGSGAYVVLGALALCVLALAGYVLTTNTIKQHEADLTALEARSATVMAESARLKPYADFRSMAQARIATVRDLATQRFDWEQAFRDLAHALPEDVTVKTLGASVSSQSGSSAGTSSPLRAALDVPAIQIDGCTSSQRGVATMMARLRGVDGVTRVSLQGSHKSTEASNVVTDAAAGSAPAGCEAADGSTPPDFTVVVFFEDAAAAAVAPTGDPATGAAPSATGSASPATGAQAQTTGATPTTTTVSTSTEGTK
jgi:Tfp pilus assembly protein PilN